MFDIFRHAQLDRIERALSDVLAKLNRMEKSMSAQLDRLTSEVTETSTAVDSVITLLAGLSQQIRDLKDEPAKLTKLADDLDAAQSRLADAVVANTPSEEPEPTTTPAP